MLKRYSPKVREFDNAELLEEHNILRLEVAVDDVELVTIRDGSHDLPEVVPSEALAEPCLVLHDVVVQVSAVTQL